MQSFLDIVASCWDLLDDGIDFLFEHPYVLIGSGLSVLTAIIATGKRAVHVSRK